MQKRGRPLTLSAERFAQLNQLWVQHQAAGEAARLMHATGALGPMVDWWLSL